MNTIPVSEQHAVTWGSKFSIFNELMKHRIVDILLVSNTYDLFTIEEDGQLSDLIMAEYLELSLSNVPRITHVETSEDALKLLETKKFDLVILMLGTGLVDYLNFGKAVKDAHPLLPLVLLVQNAFEVEHFIRQDISQYFDKLFVWQGDVRLFLAIIKLMEDKLNVEEDVSVGDVLIILLVEDSVRFYSAYLPLIYTELMKQTRVLLNDQEELNQMNKLLRMRARPKILLVENYSDAEAIYLKYKHNILALVTDAEFPAHETVDSQAGVKLIRFIRKEFFDIPILLQSSSSNSIQELQTLRVSFVDKNKKSFLKELRAFLQNNLGFGDFFFRFPDGSPVPVPPAKDLASLAQRIQEIPDDSLRFHAEGNHISRWLKARTEFKLARTMRKKSLDDFTDLNEVRRYISGKIYEYLESKKQGEVVVFSVGKLSEEITFAKCGTGSLGGKARGLAFFNALLSKRELENRYKDVRILVPQTMAIATDIFDEFLETNNLRRFVSETHSKEETIVAFLQSKLSNSLYRDLDKLLDLFTFPLAVRSSSLLEDSKYLPFAGVYLTLLLPNCHPSKEVRLQQLLSAIKIVYASMFFPEAKAYINTTPYHIEEEKMGIVIQRIIGARYKNNLFYPAISGVARSFNHYPVPPMTPQQGIVSIALGLGKIVVDGGQVYRFCPAYPTVSPQMTQMDEFLQNSQKDFYALDLAGACTDMVNSEMNLVKVPISTAEGGGPLHYIGSTYVPDNDRLYDGIWRKGYRVITFAPILRSKLFPLAELLTTLLQEGRYSMGCDVEIEFAVNMDPGNDQSREFGFLQIRPAVTGREQEDVSLNGIQSEHLLCTSEKVLGNKRITSIRDVIYARPDTFDRAKTLLIAEQIDKVNVELKSKGTSYLLIGFGRWGSSDPWLGIPVNWGQISNAAVIIESGLANFHVEPSQGTHFFQNLISLGVGYFTVNPGKDGIMDWDWLDAQPAVFETDFIRHIRLDQPLDIRINGRLSKGVILTPIS